MSSLITNATIQIRQDTAGNWTSTNPTPAAGEWCLEIDTKYIKIGDGSTEWTSLDYQPNPAEVDTNTSNIALKLDIVDKRTCKAWVNFDGSQSGTITPRDSFNVTNITKNGTGDYTINFINDMGDTNYCAVITARNSITNNGSADVPVIFATGSLQINHFEDGTLRDSVVISVQIFGS